MNNGFFEDPKIYTLIRDCRITEEELKYVRDIIKNNCKENGNNGDNGCNGNNGSSTAQYLKVLLAESFLEDRLKNICRELNTILLDRHNHIKSKGR